MRQFLEGACWLLLLTALAMAYGAIVGALLYCGALIFSKG